MLSIDNLAPTIRLLKNNLIAQIHRGSVDHQFSDKLMGFFSLCSLSSLLFSFFSSFHPSLILFLSSFKCLQLLLRLNCGASKSEQEERNKNLKWPIFLLYPSYLYALLADQSQLPVHLCHYGWLPSLCLECWQSWE